MLDMNRNYFMKSIIERSQIQVPQLSVNISVFFLMM